MAKKYRVVMVLEGKQHQGLSDNPDPICSMFEGLLNKYQPERFQEVSFKGMSYLVMEYDGEQKPGKGKKE